MILEAVDLSDFFEEFSVVRADRLKQEAKQQERLKELANELDNPDASMIDRFIDDHKYRAKMLRMLSKFSVHLISGFVSFLNTCIDETWTRSEPSGAFEGYNQNLTLILDILTTFPVGKFPPALFQTAAYGLERVAYYIGDRAGQSWAAKNTWDQRKNELTNEMIEGLKSFARQHRYPDLKNLLKSIAT